MAATLEREAETYPPVRIPLCVPHLGGNEWDYVKECLDTNWVSSVGRFVDLFEQRLAEYVGARHAVATVNGTAALHIALLLAGVEPGDEVLLPDLTFIAPANAVRYCGAHPVLVDVEADHWNLDSCRVGEFLRGSCVYAGGELRNRASGQRVRALLVVHSLGHPADMAPLVELAGEFQLPMVEDATESLGASYRERMVGAIGRLGCLSFNGNKLITSGGGGMIVTDDEELAARARYLTTQARDDDTEYWHNELGYNYRLTNVLAAIGLAQLERIEQHLAAKRRIAERYQDGLRSIPGVATPREAESARSAWWMYTVLIDHARYGMNSRSLLRYLRRQGIETRPLWAPLHCLPPYRDCQTVGHEVADRVYEQALSLPCSVGAADAQIDEVVAAIRGAAER